MERFGVAVGDATLREAVAVIQSGKAKLIRRQSLRVTIWELEIHGLPTRVVYDKNTKEIVTILRTGEEVLP